MNIDKNNYNIQNEMTVGLGAVTGGAGAYAITRLRNNALAEKALDAMNGNQAKCDEFIAKHTGLMKKSVLSKKGFFGKLNNILRESKEGINTSEDVKKGAETLLESYKDKAAKALTKKGKTPLNAEISELERKYVLKDISKTFRSASKLKSALVISSAALFSAIAFNAIREVALDVSAKKLLKKTENDIKKEDISKKLKDNSEAKKPEEKIEYYPEGEKKSPVKSVH